MTARFSSVFFGTPAFAVPSLQAAAATTDLKLVVTQPDRPRGRGQKLSPCEVKEAALAMGVPVFSPPSLKKESEELQKLNEALAAHRPDFLLVTAYGNLLPQSFLDLPKIGPINVHASLLPRWRGAAPIQRAVEAGDTETGVCLQKMVMALDAGDVLAEHRCAITPTTTSSELFASLAHVGGEVLRDYLSKFRGTSLTGTPQDPNGIVLAPKISKDEGLWNPDWTARELRLRLCAFDAWPGVRAKLADGREFKLIKGREAALSETSVRTGELIVKGEECLLGCSVRTGEPSAFVIESIQFAGKGATPAAAVFRNILAAGQTSLQILKI